MAKPWRDIPKKQSRPMHPADRRIIPGSPLPPNGNKCGTHGKQQKRPTAR